jgi:hypothetical protein
MRLKGNLLIVIFVSILFLAQLVICAKVKKNKSVKQKENRKVNGKVNGKVNRKVKEKRKGKLKGNFNPSSLFMMDKLPISKLRENFTGEALEKDSSLIKENPKQNENIFKEEVPQNSEKTSDLDNDKGQGSDTETNDEEREQTTSQSMPKKESNHLVQNITISKLDKENLTKVFKEALAENSMSKLLYAISYQGLFRKEGESELKHEFARWFLEKLEEKPQDVKTSTNEEKDQIKTAFYLNFLYALKFCAYSQEFSLFLMWIAANVEASTIVHQILFNEAEFSYAKKQYFLEYALSTRNLFIYEALESFLRKFYEGPAVASDNLAKALARCSELGMHDFLRFIFTSNIHTKYPVFYWRLQQIKLFSNPVFDELVDRNFNGKPPDKTFAPLIK